MSDKHYALHIAGRNAAGDNNECKFIKAAKDLEELTRARHYNVKLLKRDEVTPDNIESVVKHIAEKEIPDDGTFLMTYTGHGTDPHEVSCPGMEKAEGWSLTKSVDYHEKAIWRLLVGKFKPSVRVVVISDCCHAEAIDPSRFLRALLAAKLGGAPVLRDLLLKQVLDESMLDYIRGIVAASESLCERIKKAPEPECKYMHISSGKGRVLVAECTRVICELLTGLSSQATYADLFAALKQRLPPVNLHDPKSLAPKLTV